MSSIITRISLIDDHHKSRSRCCRSHRPVAVLAGPCRALSARPVYVGDTRVMRPGLRGGPLLTRVSKRRQRRGVCWVCAPSARSGRTDRAHQVARESLPSRHDLRGHEHDDLLAGSRITNHTIIAPLMDAKALIAPICGVCCWGSRPRHSPSW